MDQIEVACKCGRIIKPKKLSFHTKEDLIRLLDMEPMPDELLNPSKPKTNKRLGLKELIEVLKMRIRPIVVECKECHEVIDLFEKLVPIEDRITVRPYRGSCENRFSRGYPSFNG